MALGEAFANLISIATLSVLVVFLGREILRRTRTKGSDHWPITEGTIESAGFEVVRGGEVLDYRVPSFAFSYSADGKFYGGRFQLLPFATDPSFYDPQFVPHMVGRKIQIRYDPRLPRRWFIAEQIMEGCKVKQDLAKWPIV